MRRLAILVMFVCAVLVVAGCAPYVEYQHLDATPMHSDNQAYDFLCAGLTHDYQGLSVSTGVCHNVRGREFLTINARYTFRTDNQ